MNQSPVSQSVNQPGNQHVNQPPTPSSTIHRQSSQQRRYESQISYGNNDPAYLEAMEINKNLSGMPRNRLQIGYKSARAGTETARLQVIQNAR